ERVVEIPPGLDPLSPRSSPLQASEVRQTLARFGIAQAQPLLVQVGPLDVAHDPLGALPAYREVKALRPEVQLVLLEPLGSAGGDAWARFEQVLRRAEGDPGGGVRGGGGGGGLRGVHG